MIAFWDYGAWFRAGRSPSEYRYTDPKRQKH